SFTCAPVLRAMMREAAVLELMQPLAPGWAAYRFWSEGTARRTQPAKHVATCGTNKVAQRVLQLGGKPYVRQWVASAARQCSAGDKPRPSRVTRRTGALTRSAPCRQHSGLSWSLCVSAGTEPAAGLL